MSPYEGTKPYAFVSFSQTDAELVMPIVQMLSDMGYRLWFDRGDGQLDQRILRLSRSAVVIAFAAPDAELSGTCRQDVYYAQGQNKPVLGVFPGTPGGEENRKKLFGEALCVCRADYTDEAAFVEAICGCPELDPCRDKGSSRVAGGKTDLTPVKEWVKKYWPSLAAVAAAALVLLIGYHVIHIWSTASCTEPAVCMLCGKERSAASGHDWMAADCRNPETCRRCGEIRGAALGHDWIPATCTAPQTCVACGETMGEAIDHQWQEATYDTPRTCVFCGLTDGEPLESSQSQPQIQVEPGDLVYFGSYEQDNDTGNGNENIRWVVLEVEGDYALLLSEYALDCKPYHSTGVNSITWEDCSLRSWLNDEFLNTAFTAGHRMRIVLTRVPADDNPDYGTEAGKDTEDYVFLLSIAEVRKYYPDYPDRICEPTAYARAQGAFSHTDPDRGGWWWMRTPGASKDFATSVNSNGILDIEGSTVTGTKGSVRPAIWVRLN